MNRRVRNALVLIGGLVVLGAVVGLIDRRVHGDPPVATSPQPDRVVDTLPATPKIYRLEATLEELRRIPALDGMKRADELATKMLPPGLEVKGKVVPPDDVLEGYAHPSGQRFFVIMKPGTRAYSVFLEPTR